MPRRVLAVDGGLLVAAVATLLLSLATVPAEAGCSKKVTLFSASWCPYCKQVRAILARNEIKYSLFDATKPDVQSVMRKLFGDTSVPRTVIGDVVIEGVDEDRIKQLCTPKAEDDTPSPLDIKLPDFPRARHDAERPRLAMAARFQTSALP